MNSPLRCDGCECILRARSNNGRNSRFHSLTWVLAKKRRKLVRTLVLNSYGSGAGSHRMMLVWSGTVKNRIAMWATAGFLVAGFWALFAIATFPSTNERMRDVWTLVSLTCPAAIAGRHYPISLYEVLAANAVTYALVGLIVENLQRQLHHAK